MSQKQIAEFKMPGGMKRLYDTLVAAESEPGYEEPQPRHVPKARNATKRKVEGEDETRSKSDPQLVEYIPIVRGMSKDRKTKAEKFNHYMRIAVASGRVIDESSNLVLDYDPVTRQVLIEINTD